MVSLGTQPANRKSGFGHSSPTGARAQDLSRQLKEFYGLDIVVVPPHRRSQRRDHEDVIFTNRAAKLQALVTEIART